MDGRIGFGSSDNRFPLAENRPEQDIHRIGTRFIPLFLSISLSANQIRLSLTQCGVKSVSVVRVKKIINRHRQRKTSRKYRTTGLIYWPEFVLDQNCDDRWAAAKMLKWRRRTLFI